MTFMKAKLIAIILALIICTDSSHVTVYTDSKSFIEKYTSLLKDNNRFKYSHSNLKDTYTKYWRLLFHIIDTLYLKLLVKKVKAHRNNKLNNEADHLAKEAVDLPNTLVINTNEFSQVNVNFKHEEIERNIRNVIKEVTNVQHFMQFIQLNRNKKYLKSNINWTVICSIISDIDSTNVTSFHTSFHRYC